ncbi:MAG: PilZ domain-containing protein, partial [Treponema sp.]|nr:PilZ domain-containing protein [Treponema sp.]
MGVVTSQKISVYYERFKGIDVTFTKEIIQVTGLIAQQVHLKCVSDFWPCVIYSSSFQGAKVVANIKSGLVEKLQQANNYVSLRYCFKSPDKGNPVTFFVNARVLGFSPYGSSKDVATFTIQFTQRPPDDLIEIMGRLLDANVNSAKRREERILVTSESLRKLNIVSKEIAVFIEGVPRRCILRDISFSGAKLIMIGVAKFLVDREASMRISFDDPPESFLLKGKFVRSENVEGKKELIALAIQFYDSGIPMGYKIRINDYLSTVRADSRSADSPAPKGAS